MRLHVENVSKTSGPSLFGSLNKNLNNFETNRFYSSILSSNFKSTEGTMKKNTPISQSSIM